ncbi:hypothetical protein [Methanococcus voltae]|uniref:DNA primase large subunit PriL n=1 Tax=Methanococcus voltae (strain ATCC BAA-1334 / A3) TaxID=456320 RepID=D7DQE8_METV3|nr:hypothetical protein [Methanococcus voltae]MCS3901691.1 DNA primase large subunit [Methanococcus voltae]
MFLEKLKEVSNLNLIEELEKNENKKLIHYRLKSLFETNYENDKKPKNSIDLNKNTYYEYIQEFYDNIHPYDCSKDILINYLILIIISYSKYNNYYVKKISEELAVREFKPKMSRGGYEIDIWTFIKIASNSHNNDLHLERMDLSNKKDGIYVHLTEEIYKTYLYEKIRLEMKEAVQKIKAKKISEDLKAFFKEYVDLSLKDVKIVFNTDTGIKIEYEGFNGVIPEEWHPPCIRELLNDILTGGSPSHYARRSFVVYWFVSQMNPNVRPLEDGEICNKNATDIASEEDVEKFIDDLIAMFSTVGDFDTQKTRYYISHNIGYKVTDHITHCEYCKNWKIDGGKGLNYYCRPDDICNLKEITHPLDYLCYNINKYSKTKDNEKNKDNKNNDELKK